MPQGPSADPSCSTSGRGDAGNSCDRASLAPRCCGRRWEGQEPKGEPYLCGTFMLSMSAEPGTSLHHLASSMWGLLSVLPGRKLQVRQL